MGRGTESRSRSRSRDSSRSVSSSHSRVSSVRAAGGTSSSTRASRQQRDDDRGQHRSYYYYPVGKDVEYYSKTKGRWIDATVEWVHSNGSISLDCKARADPANIRSR